MSVAPEKLEARETIEIAESPVVSPDYRRPELTSDIRSHAHQRFIPQALLGDEKLVFKGTTPTEQLPVVRVVDNEPQQPGRPAADIYGKTKVGRGEGFYQSASRLIGNGYTHQEKLALAHAIKAVYGEETQTRPELKGRKADGSDMRMGHQLMREDNFDAVMEKLKKADPKLYERVLSTLTAAKPVADGRRNPYNFSGSPEDGAPPGTETNPNPNPNPNPDARVSPQPADARRHNPSQVVVVAPENNPRPDLPLVADAPPPRVVTRVGQGHGQGDNRGRTGRPAPGSDNIPIRLPSPQIVFPGGAFNGRVVRTLQDRDQIWLQQTNSYGCAAFSLEMALAEWSGRQPSQQSVRYLENQPVAGTTIARAGQFPGQLSDMADLARRQGLNTQVHSYDRGVSPQTLEALNRELDQGKTALVRVINPTTGNNHWVYCIGRSQDGRYILADPSRRNNQVGGPHHNPLTPTQMLRAMNRGGAGFVSVWGSQEALAARQQGRPVYARR